MKKKERKDSYIIAFQILMVENKILVKDLTEMPPLRLLNILHGRGHCGVVGLESLLMIPEQQRVCLIEWHLASSQTDYASQTTGSSSCSSKGGPVIQLDEVGGSVVNGQTRGESGRPDR